MMISGQLPTASSPDDRLYELASILAAGVLRIQNRPFRVVAKDDEDSSESAATCLEVSSKAVLTVPTVVNGQREPETEGAAWN